MRILLMIAALIMSMSIFAQKIDINVVKDEMDDSEFVIANANNVVANDDKTIGFIIRPYMTLSNDNIRFRDLAIENVGIGDCVEQAELIILFSDGSKIVLQSWNEFNCEGLSYFTFSKLDEINLAYKTIKKIRYTNGYTYDSYTGIPIVTDYFIQIYNSIEKWEKQH